MSSLKVHLAIGKKLQEEYSFSDVFLLGCILPDMLKIMLKEKKIRKSHFEEYENGQYLPNINKFCEKYKNKNELILGYLVHLVQDRLWFKEYIPKIINKKSENEYIFLKDNTIHTAEEFRNAIYNDYSIIEIYVKEKYCIDVCEIKKYIKERVVDIELLDIIEENLIDYKVRSDTKALLSEEFIDNYILEGYINCKEVLNNIMKK